MSSRVAVVKPFSANTSSAASSSNERVCSRRRSLVQRSTMGASLPQDLRNALVIQILAGIFTGIDGLREGNYWLPRRRKSLSRRPIRTSGPQGRANAVLDDPEGGSVLTELSDKKPST